MKCQCQILKLTDLTVELMKAERRLKVKVTQINKVYNHFKNGNFQQSTIPSEWFGQ